VVGFGGSFTGPEFVCKFRALAIEEFAVIELNLLDKLNRKRPVRAP
jgi:hypothetical protein